MMILRLLLLLICEELKIWEEKIGEDWNNSKFKENLFIKI
jgi:hypothetical protein